jgi:hypothetical protein
MRFGLAFATRAALREPFESSTPHLSDRQWLTSLALVQSASQRMRDCTMREGGRLRAG